MERAIDKAKSIKDITQNKDKDRLEIVPKVGIHQSGYKVENDNNPKAPLQNLPKVVKFLTNHL